MCVDTRQMSVLATEDTCLVSTADICPVSAADICPVSTADICPVSTEDIYPVSTEDGTAAGLRTLLAPDGGGSLETGGGRGGLPPPEKLFLGSLGRTTGGVENPSHNRREDRRPYPTPGDP